MPEPMLTITHIYQPHNNGNNMWLSDTPLARREFAQFGISWPMIQSADAYATSVCARLGLAGLGLGCHRPHHPFPPPGGSSTSDGDGDEGAVKEG